MIIGVNGTGYSGSGAVLDLLKEYQENHVCDELELTFLYSPDSISDLDYHLNKQCYRYFSSDVAIRRFIRFINNNCGINSQYQFVTGHTFRDLSFDYIKSLIQCEWNGNGTGDRNDLPFLQRKFKYSVLARIQDLVDKYSKRYIPVVPRRKMYLSIKPDSFIEKTVQYTNKVFSQINIEKKKNLVIDQLFPGNCPQSCYKYVDNPFGIIVYRDPRDLYLLGKDYLKSKGRFMPLDNVDSFINYYRLIHENFLNIKENNTLVLRFEDLIYNYDSTKAIIEKKIDTSNHISPLKYFNPNISANNTQLFKNSSKHLKDIKIIENKLSDWVYNF